MHMQIGMCTSIHNYQPSGDGCVRLSLGTLSGLAGHETVRVRRYETSAELRTATERTRAIVEAARLQGINALTGLEQRSL